MDENAPETEYAYVGFRCDFDKPQSVVVEITTDRDLLSPDLWRFYGQTRLSVDEVQALGESLLAAINDGLGTMFTQIEFERK
jgi:hypothetical protein